MSTNSPVNPDENYQPKTGESASYLMRIKEAEKAYKYYNDCCDSIEIMYANLQRLAGADTSRELQIFWSTMQVVNPSIYARPPVPVVVPRFKDRKPLFTVTSELLERCCVTAVQVEDMDSVMILLRDDLGISARGVAWVNFYDKKTGRKYSREEACPEHVDRKDFVNEPARKWKEVGFCARRCWMTYDEMKERFAGQWDEIGAAVFKVLIDLKNDGGATAEPKCPVWEMWDQTNNKVVWVTDGVDRTLEEGKPHLELENFFPCPKPAFGTLQPRTLIPVPDFLQIKSQIEEINDLTDRIHKLSEAIKVKAFYEAGSEIGDAVEAALATLENHAIMVPIRNMASLSMGSNGQPLVYWPVDVIANVVNALVLLRNEVINNVYQIIGISDIMRGSTEKEETLGAQQLKAQFGSVRIRDKQRELVRIARDTIAIMAEIMAEHFSKETLLAMSQMDIPSDADIRAQVKPLEDQARAIPKQAEAQAKQVMQQVRIQAQQASQDPQMMQKAQENPGAAQQMLAQATEAAKAQVEDIAKQAQDAVNQIMEQIAKLQAKPTIEAVMRLLRDDKLRPFILDIETDSTIAADEQAEKQSRTEFVTALGGMIQQFGPVMMAKPELAPMVGGLIKFALAPFRVGRELDGLIDEAVDNMAQAPNQPPPPNPDAIKAQADAEATKQKMDLDKQLADAKLAQIDAEKKAREAEAQAKIQTTGALADQKARNEQELQFRRLTDMSAAEQRAQEKHNREMETKGMDMAAKRQDAVITHVKGVQDIEGKQIANAQSKINGKAD